MKRILFFLMFFGLSSFAFADENCASEDGGICSEDLSASTFNLAEEPDCPLTDPACPLPTGDIPPEDIPATSTVPQTTPNHTDTMTPSSPKVFYYLCISVNSWNQQYGIGFSPNYVRSTYQAYNRCRYLSGALAYFCSRPQCFGVNVPSVPFPFPGPFPGPGPGPFPVNVPDHH